SFALKNLALSYAKNDWILSIDADEVLENECIKELKNLKLQEDNIIALSRKNLYKGEWIKACGWWPDYVLRIFNKNFT
ncbi:glycosyltransferase, partial [Campylobacter jejuni]|uniref:glycosyltransferase n=1 Tax=Campylobacter jejuni TaxID=197 RepID=UPI000D56638C